MDETAAVASALGMHDSINLDGGGSTAMAVDGALVNHPSGPERAVGDALVFVEGAYADGR
jgi:exopolysaccharide biosynthesis protein